MSLMQTFGRPVQNIAQKFGIYINRYVPNYIYANRQPVDAVIPPKINQYEFEAMFEVAKFVISSGRTLLDYDRLRIINQTIRHVLLNVQQYNRRMKPPAIAEVGVYKGGSALFIARRFMDLLGPVPMVAVDTFTGHPNRMTSADNHIPGGYSDVDYQDVKQFLSPFPVEVIKGEFSTVIGQLPDKYGFAHIDVDTELSTLDCLEFFGSRLCWGGAMVVDDYKAAKCKGVALATAKFLHNHPECWAECYHTEQLVIYKV